MNKPARYQNSESLLAALARQAQAGGADVVTLRALVEEASEIGAARALAQLGLGDAHAGGDIYELRQLITAWRDLRRTAWRAAVNWLVKIMITALLVGLVLYLKTVRP
ncbi:MAG: DUF6127 family protein [Pseudomonadota bacterium]|jgi:hypothetical protein